MNSRSDSGYGYQLEKRSHSIDGIMAAFPLCKTSMLGH
jgi:hypothetical protein